MKPSRRVFLKDCSLMATGIALLPAMAFSEEDNRGRLAQLLMKLSDLNDAKVDRLMALQIDKPGDRWHGGLSNAYEIPNAHATKEIILKLGASYASPHSRYYLSDKLVKPMENAIQCLLNVQYEDGTIDLYSTNFHSTPDTAFIINYLSPTYVNLKRLDRTEMGVFLEKMEAFLKNAGKCLLVGGAHTANHRWVIASALARLNSFFPSKKYTDRIDVWLSEGIDMDPDGQYTEQSVSIYSPTCDDMFLTMGRLLEREDLMDVVRKNLDMTLYYIQPGGEVLTDASGRQDAARTGYVNGYYYTYLFFAIKDKKPAYSAVCALIEREMPERVLHYLPYILELPTFNLSIPAPSKIPDNYFKRFAHSGVFRIRRGETDMSVIEKNPTFFSFMKGNAVLQSLRLAAAFFGERGQFIAEQTDFDGTKIVLSKTEKHGYFQPFPKDKIPGDGIYEKMPREQRTLSEPQVMHYRVSISENNGKLRMDIEVEGTDHVPVSMEMSFRPGGELSGTTTDKFVDDSFFLEEGMGQYKVGKDIITFGPGLATHKWATMRGMLPKQNGNSVYITGYTPFKHTIEWF
ncbi:MAG: hypothetical protein HRU41_09610 [Saprospiraceae bacterium]|nr:hypothetical protein [Saprospiraceae bacterium]